MRVGTRSSRVAPEVAGPKARRSLGDIVTPRTPKECGTVAVVLCAEVPVGIYRDLRVTSPCPSYAVFIGACTYLHAINLTQWRVGLEVVAVRRVARPASGSWT